MGHIPEGANRPRWETLGYPDKWQQQAQSRYGQPVEDLRGSAVALNGHDQPRCFVLILATGEHFVASIDSCSFDVYVNVNTLWLCSIWEFGGRLGDFQRCTGRLASKLGSYS
jgi:hypothetical protein